jgi:hypothetical protein
VSKSGLSGFSFGFLNFAQGLKGINSLSEIPRADLERLRGLDPDDLRSDPGDRFSDSQGNKVIDPYQSSKVLGQALCVLFVPVEDDGRADA